MTKGKEYANIPKEKFNFAGERDRHDKKLDTKPRSYMQDAFSRFCKNKGSVVAAIIIIILILFAIIAPFCTPFTVKFQDSLYNCALPRNRWFLNTNFWDGCSEKSFNETDYYYYLAMGEESKNAESTISHAAIKNQKAEKSNDGSLYTVRWDSYQKVGWFYMSLSEEEYKDIQKYQDEYNVQVIYPFVDKASRPGGDLPSNVSNDFIKEKYVNDANYWYKTKISGSTAVADLDEDGNYIPVYKTVKQGEATDNYTSKMRLKGDNFTVDGVTYCYEYALHGQSYQVRVNYYEYFVYKHVYVLKDGIKEPSFLFGATAVSGQDVFACLSNGARFSFIFAIIVAAVNMIMGAIYGAVQGYYGGKVDIIMQRITDILGAVPSMIVITLLKLYLRGSSHIIILFMDFFLFGWMGMASTTRMQFYRFKNQEYVLAARTLGARDRRLMWKHIFPNALGTLVTSCALAIPSMIFTEVSLTYLGIINFSANGISTVGTIISNGQPYISTYPHISMIPSVFLMLLMLSFNLFGNGLRDAFNPSLRGSEG